MFKQHLLSSVVLVASLAIAGAVQAVPITPTVSYEDGTLLTTDGIIDSSISGADMEGITVKAYFNNGTTDTDIWEDWTWTWLNPNDGGAGGFFSNGLGGGAWALYVLGDNTFNDPWKINLFGIGFGLPTLTRLIINGQPGNTVFDIINQVEFTPGSNIGQSIQDVNGPKDLTVDAIYRNKVALNNMFYGDLYSVLDLSFGGSNSGLRAGDQLTFIADTDKTAALTPAAVPEPATVALLGMGLVGLGALRRRKRAV